MRGNAVPLAAMPVSANAQAVSPAARRRSAACRSAECGEEGDGQKEGMAWRLETYKFGKKHGLARIFQHQTHEARNTKHNKQKKHAKTGSAQCGDVGLRIALV